MGKEFRPLILETVDGRPAFINCCKIITIVYCSIEDNFIVDATSGAGISISNKAAKVLMEAIVTDLFFSSDDIDERKVLQSDGTFDRFF